MVTGYILDLLVFFIEPQNGQIIIKIINIIIMIIKNGSYTKLGLDKFFVLSVWLTGSNEITTLVMFFMGSILEKWIIIIQSVNL